MIPLDSSALEIVSRHDPPWLSAARSAAFADFERLGLPSPKDELWRYVDLDLDLERFSLPLEPGDSADSRSGARLALVDGLSTTDGVSGAGFELRPLGPIWRAGADSSDEISGPVSAADKFSAAHGAFAMDGAFLQVAPGAVVRDPVLIDVSALAPQSVSFPRIVVEIGDNAQASVVVDLASPDGLEALVVPEMDLALGSGANLQLTVLQNWGSATTALGRTRISVGRDASVTFAEAGLGGSLARLHLAVDLVGQGSSAKIVGAYFGDGDQVLDYRYFMRHAAESTTSDMFLKGAVEDQALSIFTGMIRIEEEGQRTNAYQTNRNLLLSADASAQSVPNLEILANDVKCGHGSTVGPLDEDQRYYLMSRGLTRDAADRLQVRGFFEEALAKFPEPSVLGPVRDRMRAKYERAQQEGRV